MGNIPTNSKCPCNSNIKYKNCCGSFLNNTLYKQKKNINYIIIIS